MALKSKTKRKGFSPFSLDAVNFLSADVRGAVGLTSMSSWLPSSLGVSRKSGW